MRAQDEELTLNLDPAHLAAPPDPHSSSTGVPPLEPPALVSHRATIARMRQQWWFDRWRETPCWLSSMVLHLAFMVVIGSIIRPPGHEVGATLIELALGSDEVAEDGEQAANVFEAELDETVAGEEGDSEVEAADSLEDEANDEVEPAAEVDPPEPEAVPEVEPNDDPQPTQEPEEPVEPPDSPDADESGAEQSELAFDANPFSDEPSNDVEQQREFVDVPGSFASLTTNNLAWIREAPVPQEIARRNAQDDVVDRFIDYDVGMLRGPAGRKALRAFEQLNDESIPALVRGLNKSASIQASCPVGVISTKLNYQMRRTKDPALIRYALDNIGRGVPVDAPHRVRLESLQARLRKHFLDLESHHKKLLAQRGLPSNPQLVAEMNSLAGSQVKNLAVALKSTDPQRRMAAILTLEGRDERLKRTERKQLAQVLINELRTGTPETKWQSHLTLRTLAQGYLPDSPGAVQLRDGLADDWSGLWKQADRFETERAIEGKLASAKSVGRLGGAAQAAKIYQEIIKSYPNSGFAQRAKAELQKLDIEPIARSRLRMAGALERINKTAAMRRYAEVVEDFDGTKSAKEASERLKTLQSQ